MRLIIVVLMLPFTSFSQTNFSINGLVSSEGESLPYANVFLENTTLGTTTRNDGSFTIEGVYPGNYTLVASFTGHETIRKRILISNKNITVHFNLKSGELLNEVVITGTMKAVSKLESAVPVEIYTATFLRRIQHQMFLKHFKMLTVSGHN